MSQTHIQIFTEWVGSNMNAPPDVYFFCFLRGSGITQGQRSKNTCWKSWGHIHMLNWADINNEAVHYWEGQWHLLLWQHVTTLGTRQICRAQVQICSGRCAPPPSCLWWSDHNRLFNIECGWFNDQLKRAVLSHVSLIWLDVALSNCNLVCANLVQKLKVPLESFLGPVKFVITDFNFAAWTCHGICYSDDTCLQWKI